MRYVVTLRKTCAVSKQGALYVGAFFVTWLFPTISRVVKLLGGDPPIWLVALSGSFIPIQGFFNAFIYFWLRFLKCARNNPNRSVFWVVITIIQRALCCCNKHDCTLRDGLDIEKRSSSQNRASAVSPEPELSLDPEPEQFAYRRFSSTSLQRGIRGLQSLYLRTNTLFYGGNDDGSATVPNSIAIENTNDPNKISTNTVEVGENKSEL